MLCSRLPFITTKGHRLKSAKGRNMGEYKSDKAQLPVFLPQWSRHLILPATVHENTHQVLPLKETHPSLGVQGFYWGPLYRYEIFHVQLYLYSPAPQGSNWCSMAQGSKQIKTDLHYKSCWWCELSSIAQDPRYTKTLLSGRIFQSLRRDLPGQGPVLSLECVGLNIPNLTY